MKPSKLTDSQIMDTSMMARMKELGQKYLMMLGYFRAAGCPHGIVTPETPAPRRNKSGDI